MIAVLLAMTVAIGGGLSLLASANPDGLEWSMQGVAGTTELEAGGPIYQIAAKIQEFTAVLPDYSFKNSTKSSAISETSASGVIGGGITLSIACLAGYLISRYKKKAKCDKCQN
jgi:cobalt/nickel transport system permease protein